MASIPVRVEPPGENPVLEVLYDGMEILQPPLSMSDHLAKQARKVDFNQVEDDEDGMEVEEEEEVGEDKDEKLKSFQQPVWPWESVRNKLRDALTELSVMSDVLSISTKDCGKDPSGGPRRYMVLDGPVQLEPIEQKQYVSLLAKKRALEAPTKILLQGAEHLRNLQNETKGSRTPEDFHIELLRLRQNWRLKKVGNTILGDLSYRTAGSAFKQSGVFEVSKADENLDSQGSPSSGPSKAKSALKVTVPSELEGIAYIQVTIQRDNEQLVSATLNQFGGVTQSSKDLHWQNKLEAAHERPVLQRAVQPAGQGGCAAPSSHPSHGGWNADHCQPVPRHTAHHLPLSLHGGRQQEGSGEQRADKSQ